MPTLYFLEAITRYRRFILGGISCMSLSNVRISAKILFVVASCSLVTLLVAAAGYMGIGRLSQSLFAIEATSRNAIAATKLSQMALRLNRSEYVLASDPSADSVRENSRIIETQRKELDAALEQLKSLSPSGQAEPIKVIEAGRKAYLAAQDETIAKVKQYGAGVEVSEGQMIITEAAATSSTVATRLEKAVEAYTETATTEAAGIFDQAARVQSTAQWTMIVVTVAGTIGGFVFGILLGRIGVSRPMEQVVDSLRRLAGGDTEITVYGLGRGDEIGTIAGTLDVFKQNILRGRAAETEAKAAFDQAERDKIRAMNGLADSLDATVSQVVDTLSSAAAAMQVSAQSMSEISKAASTQAVTVAAAAEQASVNVETVASAAEELTSSIGEISRRVAQAATVSGQAVAQASRTTEIVTGLACIADHIGEVVGLINAIAGQTNLLALNATKFCSIKQHQFA